LSHPVVNGFTNAAAIIIASSQLSKMFGVYVDKAEHHYETIFRVVQAAFHYTHWPTLGMGALAFGIMYGLRRISPKIPNVLVAVIITTLISWLTGFQHNETVDITAIESPEVREMVKKFNESVAIIPTIAEQRTEVNKALDVANRNKDIIGVLDAEHEINVLTINMARINTTFMMFEPPSGMYCSRAFLQPDGSLKFYPKDELPKGAEGDGRTWRIKVGNKALKTDQLLMIGGGVVVGKIPSGLPTLSMPKVDLG
jgi:SulP family sulfate permease